MFTNNWTDIHLGGGFFGVVATHLEAFSWYAKWNIKGQM
jgi:hypothetical protein